MKRTLLYLSLALIGVVQASAQTTILIDRNFDQQADFNDVYAIDADGDGFNWGNLDGLQDSENVNIYGGFLFSASFNQEAQVGLTPDNLLALPVVSIPEGATNVQAYLKIGSLDFTEFEEHYAIYAVAGDADTSELIAFAADGITEPSEVLAILGTPLFEETLANYTAVNKVVDLTAFAGQDVRLIVRHFNSSDEYFIALDGYRVTNTTLGLDENLMASVKIFPNPVNSLLHINTGSAVSASEYKIFDLHGRMVADGGVSDVETTADVSGLASGIYILELETSLGKAAKRFIKN